MLLFKDCTPSPHPSFVHILLTHACWKDLYSALRLCSSTSSAVTSPYSLPHSQERGAFYSVIPQEFHFPCKDSHCVISSWPVLCPKLWSPWGQCLQRFISPGTCMTSGRNELNICCKAGLVELNFVNFCLSERLFISPSILRESLTGCSNLGCRFFLFSTLNIFFHSLLACRVSAERSVKHMGFPLYFTCCFSLAAFNFLSLCLVFVSLCWFD